MHSADELRAELDRRLETRRVGFQSAAGLRDAQMSAVREAVLLPLGFSDRCACLGGFEPGGAFPGRLPSLFSLVLAVMLVGALVRSGALAPDRLLHAARPILANANGAVVLVRSSRHPRNWSTC